MSDLISREALNDVKFVVIKGDKVEEAYRNGWNSAIECIIENAPSAEAVEGEWIDRSDGGRIKYPWWESCKCNQCGEYGSGAYNFCPNCGADMRGEEE